MYLLVIYSIDATRTNTILFSVDREKNNIRKWSLLTNTPENRQLVKLIALACCGRRFAGFIPYHFQSNQVYNIKLTQGKTSVVGYTMALHHPFDYDSESSVFREEFLSINLSSFNTCGEVLTDDFPAVKTNAVFNIRKKDNASRFSLAYGSELHPHKGTDDFDFNEPLYKLNRYNTLFNNHSLITDPIAFLARLHYKAIRCGRYPAKQTMQRLCQFFLEYLDIDTSKWQDKGNDFQELWEMLEGWQQRSILPILDMARHLIDAFPKSGKPLHMHGVVVLDTPNNHCSDLRFFEWVKLVDTLFPNIQFIATFPAKHIALFPEQVSNSYIVLPEKVDKPTLGSIKKSYRVRPNTVSLIHIDGKLPNLALMKLSTYHKSLGYNIKLLRKPELIKGFEFVFASSVFFTKSSQRSILRLKNFYGSSISIGGSGIDLKLRLPSEIELCSADYDLYSELGDRAIGFVTRGCPYRCKFCLVPDKEGDVHQVSDLRDLLKGRRKLILLDDNLLAYPNVEGILEDMANQNLSVNFTQTLDIRLLNRDLVTFLKKIGWSNTTFTRSVIHFSLNGISGLDRITQNYRLFDFRTTDNVEFVCMYDYDTTLEEDVERFRFIRSLPGAYVFVQRYQPTIDASPKPRVVFFDSNADKLISDLIKIEYRQNMKSMEKYYRWLSQCYVKKFGHIHKGLVDMIFRYNNRDQKGLYIASLLAKYGEKSGHA